MMPTTMRRRLGAALAVGTLLAAAPFSRVDQADVTLAFRLAASIVRGEPIVLETMVTNRSASRVRVDLGLDGKTQFEFVHRSPNGGELRVRPQPSTNGMSFIASMAVLPGRAQSRRLVLDEWLDMSELGRHSIAVSFRGPIVDAAGRTISVDRNATFTVVVTEKDERILRSRCETWLSEATSTNGESATIGLQALRYVNDPVAIPYLVTAIEHRQWSEGFSALRRIGTPEAIKAVEGLTRSGDPLVAAMAKSFLATIGRGRG